ncbi:MAG: AEC family transporter [Paracoccus sp. (in: a-proteobacteria)]|nr:AEC family transporter [Paracoccus sp. (in: a-proteobacteria)]
MLLTIWPIFALILLGFGLARRGFPSSGFWPEAERINYFLLFPALLISSLANAPLSDPGLLRLGGAAVVTILVASALLWLYRRARPMPAARFGPLLQGAIRFNTYLGLAILAPIHGLERAAIYLAIAVPLVNLLSIIALGDGAKGRMARIVAGNPLILACIAGIGLAASGIGLPLGLDRLLALIGQGSLPLGLLCVGAALQLSSLRRDLAGLGAAVMLRLVLMPGLALLVAALFGLGREDALVLVVFSAVATAPSAYVLTRQLNGDGAYMAGIVTAQTIAAAISLPVVLALFDLIHP